MYYWLLLFFPISIKLVLQDYQLSLLLWRWKFSLRPFSTKKKKAHSLKRNLDLKVLLKKSIKTTAFCFRTIRLFALLFVHPKSYVYVEGVSIENPDISGHLFAVYQNISPEWIVWDLDFQKEFKLDKMQLSMMILPISSVIFLFYLILAFPYRLWWGKE